MTRHAWRRRATWGLAIVALATGGCSFFPESLQPMNLQHWNRYPGPTSDPFFSVPDNPQTDSAASLDSGTIQMDAESD